MTAPHDESHDRHPVAAQAAGTVEAGIAAEAEVEASATDRVITFSDAVVAIAITLLALALTPPDGVHIVTNGQLLDALRAQHDHYLAFLISFLVIGNHWATHRKVFRYVCRWNVMVGRLNMLWLLMMILVPVAAQLLAGTGAFPLRFSIYALIQVIATGSLLFMRRETIRAGLLRPDAPEQARHPDTAPYIALCIVFLVSILVVFATDSAWSYAVWASSPLVTRWLRQITANGRHA